MQQPDLAISLGPNCRSAWNVRSYFGAAKAYPFDWWITPAKAMLRMLEPEFRFHVDAEDLAITPVAADGGNSVFNRRLNLLHHHDFARQDNRVQAITAGEIAGMNVKYAARFARLHADVRAAAAPVAFVNGLNRGWRSSPVDGGATDRALNGAIGAQAFVDAVRDRLGATLHVVIVTAGPEAREDLAGGTIIARPDRGLREPREAVKPYAEPVHVFRECYAALGFSPAATVPKQSAEPQPMMARRE